MVLNALFIIENIPGNQSPTGGELISPFYQAASNPDCQADKIKISISRVTFEERKVKHRVGNRFLAEQHRDESGGVRVMARKLRKWFGYVGGA